MASKPQPREGASMSELRKAGYSRALYSNKLLSPHGHPVKTLYGKSLEVHGGTVRKTKN